jgi:hypothetical protein
VWLEYGDHLARWVGLSAERSMTVVGFGVLFLCWLAAVIADPTHSDNHPRRPIRATDNTVEETPRDFGPGGT